MNTYVFDQTGRCMYSASVPVEHEGCVVIHAEETLDPNVIWYDHAEGKMLGKTVMPVTIFVNRIEDIPAGSTVLCKGQVFTVDDGVFEIDVAMPEVVPVTIMHVSHLTFEAEVQCEVQA
jgi:hypothetical protein